MDDLVLSGLDGLKDWLPLNGPVDNMLPFPPLSGDALMSSPIMEGMPCFQAVILTSMFCVVLTAILLLMCRLCPLNELELILDMNSTSAHVDTIQQHGRSVRRVKVKAFREFEEAELIPIFEELQRLPRLQSFAADLRLPFSMLSMIVGGAKKLNQSDYRR